MKRIYIVLIIIVLLFTGCNNEKEEVKSEYLTMKSKLLKVKEFNSNEDINFDILVSVDRVDEENVSYKMVLSNPMENMHDIKAILIHNYYTEDVFPSIGLFDKVKSMHINSNDSIDLEGVVKTDKSIDNLGLILKLYVKYLDDYGNEKSIYYKTTK